MPLTKRRVASHKDMYRPHWSTPQERAAINTPKFHHEEGTAQAVKYVQKERAKNNQDAKDILLLIKLQHEYEEHLKQREENENSAGRP